MIIKFSNKRISVFKSDSEENEELSFADAYKNDILQNREPKREDNSYKIAIIMV